MTAPIALVQTVQTVDAQGFGQSSNTVLANVRAYREERHGTKIWANRAAFSEATHLFRFRVIPGVAVTPALALLCAGVRYTILSIEVLRGMYIECLCEEISPTKG